MSLVLALCVAVFVSTIAGVDASEAATAEMLEEYEEIAESTLEESEQLMTAIIVMGGGWRPGSEEPMDEDVADEVATMDNVAAVVPMVRQGFGEAETVGGPFDRSAAYVVNGVPLDLDEQYHVLPVNIVEGRSLVEGEDNAVLIGDELTDYFEAGVGDTIDIEGTSFEVVGVYSRSVMENDVYMSLSTA
ncbi:MAG: ABC transporter permease, partial [Armatimonadetes bacterium]|nr:ABC transporter permease [Armatimonadota bacterium]